MDIDLNGDLVQKLVLQGKDDKGLDVGNGPRMFDGIVIVDRIMQKLIVSAAGKLMTYSIGNEDGKFKVFSYE
jgi:hypothetical protein